jgi:hypothetical protein
VLKKKATTCSQSSIIFQNLREVVVRQALVDKNGAKRSVEEVLRSYYESMLTDFLPGLIVSLDFHYNLKVFPVSSNFFEGENSHKTSGKMD